MGRGNCFEGTEDMNKITIWLVAGLFLTISALGGCTGIRDFYGMELVNNPKAQNVDSATLLAFLEQDKVNENSFVEWDYVCVHFARDLHNNAEVAGIRCAVVWTANRGHVFNAFETTDKGVVFVDASKGPDGFAYDRGGTLVVDGRIPEGIHGENVIITGYFFNLGHSEDFEIEW